MHVCLVNIKAQVLVEGDPLEPFIKDVTSRIATIFLMKRKRTRKDRTLSREMIIEGTKFIIR